MDSAHLKPPTVKVLHDMLSQVVKKKIIKMATGIHFGFMQIKKIAQGCRLGNHAECVLGSHVSSLQITKTVHRTKHF